MDQENLEKMLISIKHRGPDSKGDYRNNFISMGMQRLSIIDIDGGDQPISDHKKIWSLITLASWFKLRENNSNRNKSIKELIK